MDLVIRDASSTSPKGYSIKPKTTIVKSGVATGGWTTDAADPNFTQRVFWTTGVDGRTRSASFRHGGNDTCDGMLFHVGNFTAVPEPSSTALLGLGALDLLARRKR